MTAPGVEWDQAGFTLVETLICLVLLGFLGSLMMTSHQLVIGDWRRLEARAEAGRSVAAAQTVLRDRLTRIFPDDDAADHTYVFDGTPTALSFVAPLPQRTGTSTLGLYALRDRDGSLELGSALGGGSREDSTIILHDVAGVELSYFGRDSASDSGYWHDSWQQRDTLPELVRVRLTRTEDVGTPWPDLVVEPKITSGIRCTFFQADSRCHAP